ncbi:MAG: hypothetical protein R2856_15790 [Caldilineaceae bacterium]
MEESADAGEPSRVIVAQSVDLKRMEPYMIGSPPRLEHVRSPVRHPL